MWEDREMILELSVDRSHQLDFFEQVIKIKHM